MSTALPVHAAIIDEPHPSLVHERGGFERVLRALTRHPPPRDEPQLVIDDGQELVPSHVIPPTLSQESSEPFARCFHKIPARRGSTTTLLRRGRERRAADRGAKDE